MSNPRKLPRKPNVLKKKNIMRKKGATSQAKQIDALSRSLSKMNRVQYERIRTFWQRDSLPVGSGGAIATNYICPVPYALCDPNAESPLAPNSQRWSDNRAIASQPYFTKRLVFGRSQAADNSNCIYHTGGILRYQVTTTEPSYTKATIMLIKPKRNQAAQLVIDRDLKTTPTGGYSGGNSRLYRDIDYTVHSGQGGPNDTWFGAEINSKYWTTLYKREVGLGSIKDTSASSVQRVTPVENPKNNSLIATGKIRLPAGGVIKAVGYATQQSATDPDVQAMEQQYIDQRPEDTCYLVVVNNDLTIDGQNLSMGFCVTDYYKAVV